MQLTRREFHRLVVGSATCSAGILNAPRLWAQEQAAVPFQPFAASVERLLAALASLGTPLSLEDTKELRNALRASAAQERVAVETITRVLDRYVLMQVELNPEMRVAVGRGAAVAELYQSGWRTFLIRVQNHAGTTPVLTIKSPQGGSMGRRSSLAITGVHDFTNGAVDEVEARNRWIAVDTFNAPPITNMLSGLGLEYRIVQLYSRDAGQREATLRADAGWGEQDLGFRSSLPILFRVFPAQIVPVLVRDERGAASIASLTVTDALNRVYPPQTKRETPDLNFQPQVYRYDGETVLLPAGHYNVEYSRGPEYISQRISFEVSEKNPQSLKLELKRWITPASYGYYSGDTHIHAAGCSHYESPTEGVTPIVMERQVDGEALDLGSVLNWGPGFEYQKQFFSGHALPMQHAHFAGADAQAPHVSHGGMPHDPQAIAMEETQDVIGRVQHAAMAPTVSSLVRYDVEVSGFPSSHCGHLVLLRLRDDQYPGAKSIDDWPSWNAPILRWAKAQGAVVGYAHSAHGLVVDNTSLPNYVIPPFNSMGANEFIADVTHEGLVDFISGCDLWPFAELNIWYHTLNCGYMTAFAGETDFPCLTDACVGGGRSYVPLSVLPERDEGYSAWLQGLLHSSSYFGDGRSHIFDLRVNGQLRSPSGVSLPVAGTVEVTAQVCARLEPMRGAATEAIQHASPYDKPYWHVERARVAETRNVAVELVINGVAVDRSIVPADGQVRPISFRVPVPKSSWVALRIYPSSHTNPVFVTVAGKPVRASRESAVWCRKGVDVCWEQKKQRIRPQELKAAAAHYEHARTKYDRILAEMVPLSKQPVLTHLLPSSDMEWAL